MADLMPWEDNYSTSAQSQTGAGNTASTNTGNIRSSSGGFKQYPTQQAGALDQMRLLDSYQNEHGLNNISGIATRWAPPKENDTKQYIKNISSISGIDANQQLDLSNPVIMGKLAYAQAVSEKGRDKVQLSEQDYIDLASSRKAGSADQRMPWEDSYDTSQSAQEAPQQEQAPQATQPQPQPTEQPQQPVQQPTANDPYAQMKGAMGQQRQQIEVPEYQKDSEAFKLSVLGTRDKADWQHPLSYFSPYDTINDVPQQTVEGAKQTQAMGRGVLKTGVYGAAYAATEGLAAPFLESLGLSEGFAGFAGRAAGNTAGSVSSQSSEAIDNPDWQGVSAGDVAKDVVAGELLHRGGELLKPGSATRRAAMTESRTADVAREQRIGEISDDIAHINSIKTETLAGKTPQQVLTDPKIRDAYRKPGETQVVPERLQQVMKGAYGNEQGQVMIDAATSGAHPTTNPAWQHTTDAAWKTPMGDAELSTATRRLENEFAASERTRPAYTLQELQDLNTAYQSGSAINPNIPLAGQVFNPSMRLGDLSPSMLERLGITQFERGGLRAGEGGEGSLFGLGQWSRQSNQEALNRTAYTAENNAKTMAGRKAEGTRLAKDDLSRLQYQHDQLSQKLQPDVEAYDQAIAKQTELTDRLKGNLSPDEHLSVLQELSNVNDEVKSLWPQARDAKTIIQNSQKQIDAQTAKLRDQVTTSNAYNKAAKQGESYRSTRDLSNYEAGKLAEAESLTRGGKTKGFNEQSYTEQQTPREVMESKESARKAADQQSKFHSTPEHKLTSWMHFISHGTTLIPHLVTTGYSRTVAKSIMQDLQRTGGKNLTGDQLRKVMAFMIDNPATIGYANSGDTTNETRATENERKKLIQEEEAYQRMIKNQK